MFKNAISNAHQPNSVLIALLLRILYVSHAAFDLKS